MTNAEISELAKLFHDTIKSAEKRILAENKKDDRTSVILLIVALAIIALPIIAISVYKIITTHM